MRLNAVSCVELPSIDGNRRCAGSNNSKLSPGFDLQGDDRHHRVQNYHILAMRRNISASIVRKDNDIFCVSCEKEHTFTRCRTDLSYSV
jgi:hypothetical protein